MSEKDAQARHYAQAIMQATVERWQETLAKAATVLSKDKQLSAQMTAGDEVDQKVASLVKALDTNLSETETNLLKTVVQAGHTQMLEDIAASLSEVASGRIGPQKAEITSAVELSDQEKEALRKKLSEQYGDNLIFSFHVNEELLGGLRVRVGDRLIDNSIASRLSALRESLISVSR